MPLKAGIGDRVLRIVDRAEAEALAAAGLVTGAGTRNGRVKYLRLEPEPISVNVPLVSPMTSARVDPRAADNFTVFILSVEGGRVFTHHARRINAWAPLGSSVDAACL